MKGSTTLTTAGSFSLEGGALSPEKPSDLSKCSMLEAKELIARRGLTRIRPVLIISPPQE